jgi:ABC-type polysaccharide/polyol phosphate transport system ATPase subunit
MSELAVKLKNISKIYRVYEKPHHRILEIITRHKKAFHFSSIALQDVSLDIARGSVIGIVGKNGSGKSTLLQIIASVLKPNSGTVEVNGRVAALLELGSGFNPEFTGLDNIYLYGSILGLSREQMDKKLQDIINFAQIGEYINLPTKTYSSGMVVRLAFATAVAVEPEILIVDEALSVGDAEFQHRCILRIREIIRSGATVIFVSHDIGTIKMLCDRAILMEHGKIVADGIPEEVAKIYHRRLFEKEISSSNHDLGSDIGFSDIRVNKNLDSSNLNLTISSEEILKEFAEKTKSTSFGTGEATILDCYLVDENNQRTSVVVYGEQIRIRIFILFNSNVESSVAGVILRNSAGVDVFTTNTHLENANIKNCIKNKAYCVEISMKNILKDDSYSINPAVCDEKNFHQAKPFHWIDNACVFRSAKTKNKVIYNFFYPTDVLIRSESL